MGLFLARRGKMGRRGVRGSGFWAEVRARIWVKARELYMADMIMADPLDPISTVMPEDKELMEAGYFQRAKVLVLRELAASTDPADIALKEKGRKARKARRRRKR